MWIEPFWRNLQPILVTSNGGIHQPRPDSLYPQSMVHGLAAEHKLELTGARKGQVRGVSQGVAFREAGRGFGGLSRGFGTKT